MAWTKPFDTDLYQKHLKRQHAEQFRIYQACTFDQKVRFFDGVTAYTNTMLPHVVTGTSAMPLRFNIRAPIIDILIGDMFFHPDDQGGITQSITLKLFKRIEGGIDGEDFYEAVIKQPEQFLLVAGYISEGISFRQYGCIIAQNKRVMGTTSRD